MSGGTSPHLQAVQAGCPEPTRSPSRSPWRELIPTLCIAIATIGFVPVLHVASPVLSLTVEVLVAIAIVVAVPTYAPAIAIFVLFFQNLFVSIL